MTAMSWLDEHLILVAALVLIALVVVGLAVLAVRAVGLWRVARDAQRRVDEPVKAISGGLEQAQGRLDRLTAHQEQLTGTVERVGVQANELGRLLGVAGKAISVLRAPLKYIGK